MPSELDKAFGLPGITITDIENTEDGWILHAKPDYDITCPGCGEDHIVENGTYVRTYVDVPVQNKKTLLMVHTNRFLCQKYRCSTKSFVPTFPGVGPEKSQITDRLKTEIANQDFRKKTFDVIASDFHVSNVTVRGILLEKGAALDRTMVYNPVEILGIDEAHLAGDMRGILVDLSGETSDPIDILPDRKKDTIEAALGRFMEPEKIRFVMIDMYRPYRDAVEMVLPGAKVVVDRYHVIQALETQIEHARKNACEKIKADISALPEPEQAEAKAKWKAQEVNHYWFKLRWENASDRQKEELQSLLFKYPIFRDIIRLREEAFSLFEKGSREEAEGSFDKLRRSLKSAEGTHLDPFVKFCKTVQTWRKYIFNFYDVPDKMMRTNAATEAQNGVLKRVNRNGYGYSFEVLRYIFLYGGEKIDYTAYKYAAAETGSFFDVITNPQKLTTPEAIRDYMCAIRQTVRRHPEIAELEPRFANPPTYADGEMLKYYISNFSRGRFGNYGVKTAKEMDSELQSGCAEGPSVPVIHPTPEDEFEMIIDGFVHRMKRDWDRDVMVKYRGKTGVIIADRESNVEC